MKLARRYTKEIDSDMWESLGDHFPISATYEFAIKDVVSYFLLGCSLTRFSRSLRYEVMVSLISTDIFHTLFQPEIYAHMLSKPDFESFVWNSATFDKESVSLGEDLSSITCAYRIV